MHDQTPFAGPSAKPEPAAKPAAKAAWKKGGQGAEPKRRMRGFEPAVGLMKERIRAAGESRGFAVARLLTHWAEVVGEEFARVSRPVKIGYGRDGFGATLTLLTTGASAPMLMMSRDKIRQKVNACYGYNAISKVVLTQTAPIGFAEGQAQFAPAPKAEKPLPSPEVVARAGAVAAGVGDTRLREALERLAANVMTKASATTDEKKG